MPAAGSHRLYRAAIAVLIAAPLAAVSTATTSSAAVVDNHLSLVSVGIGGVQPDDGSFGTAVSADGRYVAFGSNATNLVPGVTADFDENVYLRDTVSGITTLVSHKPDGGATGRGVPVVAMSADGRYLVYPLRVAVDSPRMRLVRWDRETDTTTTIGMTPAGEVLKSTVIEPAISADGQVVVYQIQVDSPDQTIHTRLYRYEATTGLTTLVVPNDLVYPAFNSGSRPAVSGNGRFIAYVTTGRARANGDQPSKLVRLDTMTGRQRVVWTTSPLQNLGISSPAFSRTGRDLAFAHVPVGQQPPGAGDDSVVSVYDASTRDVEQVSVANGGGNPNGGSYDATISGDGRYVGYDSDASDILPTPTDSAGVYLYDRDSGVTERLGANRQGVFPRLPAALPYLSQDGNSVAFTTAAQNLSPGADTDVQRAYLWTRPAD